ncbi:ABC transporter permease [Chryseobacterium soli]|uniref:ABC transporter permease n=1 Tax=Chryseobacterium soli TaxID=445961 RepID=UPI0029547557|nr:FtsX-like permease family protein [Chryseobacterium soli]MDV7695579.1 ABC transporter permease [Chryseobacterium soli]
MLKNWLKIALINYKKNALSTLINLFGLTIGLTGFMLILMHWNDEESYEKWNPKKDQIYIYQTYHKKDKTYGGGISYPIAFNAVKKIPEVEDFLLFNNSKLGCKIMTKSTTVFQKEGFTVSDSFFNFFPFKIVSGSAKDALKSETSIAISTQTAKRLFGKTEVAGETIKVDDKNFIITAVYELAEGNSQIKPQFVILPSEQLKNDKEQWGNYNYGCLFMLKKGTDPKVIQEKLKNDIIELRVAVGAKNTGITLEQFRYLYGPNGVLLTPLDKMKLHSKASWFGVGDLKTIMILFTLSVLIVVLSAINFINLKTAEASQRAKEVGVRKAIGGTRSSLMIQFFLETFIICLLSYFLSLAMTELLIPFFNKFFNKEIKLNDWHVYAYSFAMVMMVTLLSGSIPAFYLSSFKAIETLKGNFAGSKNGIWLRNGILTLQLVISSFFIIGGLIVNSQVKYMMNKDLSFNGKQVMMIDFRGNHPKPWLKYERLKTELSKINGVEAVSFGEAVAGDERISSSDIKYKQDVVGIQMGSMDYNYLQFMGVKLLKGRWLNPSLASDTISNAIVNEAFVKKFGFTDEQVLERSFDPGFDNKKYRIVGIVKDFNLKSLNYKIDPVLFFHYKVTDWKRFTVYNIQVKLKANDIDGTVNRIKKFWGTTAESGYPFEYSFIDQKFAKTFVTYQKQQTLFTILNAMVLMVALLGLFALSSLMIEQKLKDVAIRKTLGASDNMLIFGLTRQFLWITVIAVFISIPICYYLMNEWLKDFAYRIDMPVWPFIVSFCVLLVLTFAVVSIKAYKATKVNLVTYLKYE